MFLNYLKLSFRLLARNPFFTFINVLGLSVGFASFFALWQFSTSELKSDQYHPGFERIARIGVHWRWTDDGGKSWGHILMGTPLIDILPLAKEDFPETESFVRILNQSNFSTRTVGHGDRIKITLEHVKGGQNVFNETKAAYADPNLFDFFNIPLLTGEKNRVLANANDVVLSHSTAIKYFGSENPVGQIIRLNDTIALKVSGVFQDLPHYTHLDFHLVLSNKAVQHFWANPYGPIHNYLKLKGNESFSDFERKLNSQGKKYYATILHAFPQVTLDLFVQPLSEVAFSNNFVFDAFPKRSESTLIVLVIVSVVVLVMAWVNYINLTITRTTRRMKELATRKAAGANSLDLIKQFLTESFVTNLLAVCIALTFLQIIRQPAATLFNIQVDEFYSLPVTTYLIFFFITLAGIAITGLYPALLSFTRHPGSLFGLGHRPVQKRFGQSLLTIFQFAAAVVLMLWAFMVFFQLNYILDKDIGINKTEIIVAEAPVVKSKNYPNELESLKERISSDVHVADVASSYSSLGDGYSDAADVHLQRVGSDLFYGTNGNSVDERFIPFFGIQLLAGRNFMKDDVGGIAIISRLAAERLGFKDPGEAIGAKLNARSANSGWKEIEIIGVIADYREAPYFNYEESSSETNKKGGQGGRGICLFHNNKTFGSMTHERIEIRIKGENTRETLSRMASNFNDIFPGNAFVWYFLEDHINRAYGNEKLIRNQILLFTAMAIGIACLGLLGMISNKVTEKTKEIGIRKVLGAQIHQLAQLLLSATVKQLIVATAIGIPLAYYLTQEYLEKYTERISLQWWHYTLPVVILMLIMFTTVASILWKAAKSNPVEALKYE